MKLSYLFNAIFLLTSFCLSGQSNILNASIPEQIGIQNIDQLQSDLDSYLEYEFIDDRDILWSKIVYEKTDIINSYHPEDAYLRPVIADFSETFPTATSAR